MIKGRQNRSLIITTIVIALMLVFRFGSFFFAQKTGRVDPYVTFTEDRAKQISDRQRQQQIAAFVGVTEGEVFRTEERIREATALATAVSLFAARESLNQRTPANVTALLVGVNDAGLIPPGVQIDDSHTNVSGVYGQLLVRYRPDPLGVEVLSLGKNPLDGPALLVRVPGTATNNEAASLYVATTLQLTNLPTPFTNEAEIFALGFVSGPLRSAKLPQP
jgi:hypothetical protein